MINKKEITCKNCGAVYFSEEMPSSLRCICLGERFNVIELTD